MKRVILFVHGKGGNYLEGEQYRNNCPGYDIIGVDFDETAPWIAKNQILTVYEQLCRQYDSICLIAHSIGAYFSMLALQQISLEKALFISPIVDMEQLIFNMMQRADVSEQELLECNEIKTNYGETLSWEYLSYVREHPVMWTTLTEVLYAGEDNLTSRETIDKFIDTHHARLTVYPEGEHWFHTSAQMYFLNNWMKRVMNTLTTEHLTISPLGNNELKNLICHYKEIVPELSTAYQEMLDACLKCPEDALWYTAWKICLKDKMTEIGFAGFKGFNHGCPEIGYGIDEEYKGNGYATEAVCALCRWAFYNSGVAVVEAETAADNHASERVLEKCGFIQSGEQGKEGPRYMLKKSMLDYLAGNPNLPQDAFAIITCGDGGK